MAHEEPDATLAAIESREAGGRIIRGGLTRVGGYVLGTGLTAIAFALLLRHLGVADFGRFSTVIAVVTIAAGIAEGGLQAVGQRLYVQADPAARRQVLGDVLGLRFVLIPVVVGGAAGFSLLAGYDETMVVGAVVAGIGAVLTLVAVTLTIPLSVELRNGAVTAVEVARQLTICVAIAVLVIAGASLGAFFDGYLVAGAVMIPVAMGFAGRARMAWPRFDPAAFRRLVRETGPLAIAIVINTLYLKLLIILASLLTDETEVGLFATASRITEVLIAVPMFVAGTALPLMTHAAANDESRLAYAVQRIATSLLLLAGATTLLLVLAAEPIIDVFAGPGYEDAVGVLQLQAFVLLGAFLTQTWIYAIVAVQAERSLIWVNVVGLVAVLGLGLLLIPSDGAIGASIAAVAGEVVLATAGLAALLRARAGVGPALWPMARCVVPLAAGLLALALPVAPVVQTAAGLVVFAGVAVALGAVPAEVGRAVLRRS